MIWSEILTKEFWITWLGVIYFRLKDILHAEQNLVILEKQQKWLCKW